MSKKDNGNNGYSPTFIWVTRLVGVSICGIILQYCLRLSLKKRIFAKRKEDYGRNSHLHSF